MPADDRLADDRLGPFLSNSSILVSYLPLHTNGDDNLRGEPKSSTVTVVFYCSTVEQNSPVKPESDAVNKSQEGASRGKTEKRLVMKSEPVRSEELKPCNLTIAQSLILQNKLQTNPQQVTSNTTVPCKTQSISASPSDSLSVFLLGEGTHLCEEAFQVKLAATRHLLGFCR